MNNEKNKLSKREKNHYVILNGHPLLPKLFEFNISPDNPTLYIEYINGEDLNEIDTKKFDQNEIINIIFEILITIHFIHSNGLVYRDLKPDNILIDSNKVAVLIDFDRTRDLNDFSPISTSLSTDYLAPEIASGSQFDASADIFSLGKIIINKLLESENITKDIHSELEIMCEKCIEESPEDRPTISELIRYFYLNILSKIEKTDILEKLINIFEYYSEKIENLNDPDGFYTLGMIYEHGKCIDKDLEKSINFYIKAAEQGNLIAQMKLYNYYDDQNKEDLAENYLIQAAEQNDELAQFYLGTKYTFGKKADEKDEENKYKYVPVGIEYLTKSAEQDYIMTQFVLGLFYSHHPKYNDINKSKEYFLKSLSNQNITKPDKFYNCHGKYKLPDADIISEYELLKGKSIKLFTNTIIGKFYLYGISYEKDPQKAKDYLLKVAKHPFIELQNFYKENNIIEINLTKKTLKSINNFIKIINFVIIECKNTAGHCYLNEKFGKPSPNEAIEYFISAFKQNDLFALSYIAYIISTDSFKEFKELIQFIFNNNYIESLSGIYELMMNKITNKNGNINIDYNIIVELLNIKTNKFSNQFKEIVAPHLNDFFKLLSNIPLEIGDFYYYEKNDIEKAIKLYEESARFNNSSALLRLADIHFNEGKYKEAHINLEKSAKLNNPYAQYRLGYYFYKGYNGFPIDYKSSFIWFYDSAKLGNDVSQFYVGIFYYKGIYAQRDEKESIKYFMDAANKDNRYAKNNLGVIRKHPIYFDESIRISDNIAARFNLAHYYFFEEKNPDKTIEKLLKPSIISEEYGFDLLYLILIERCQQFTSQNIKKEMREINSELSESNLKNASEKLRTINERYHNSRNTLYEKTMNIELMYEEPSESYITTKSKIEEEIEKQKSHKKSGKPIDTEFLDAFE